jgi:hypothetical protein
MNELYPLLFYPFLLNSLISIIIIPTMRSIHKNHPKAHAVKSAIKNIINKIIPIMSNIMS